jgi:hypothetical protein
MVFYPIQNFKLMGFIKSNTKYKKYDAIVKNKENDRTFRVPFGDNRYEHYKDKTGLGLYSNLNHLDKKRQKNYVSRHQHFIKDGYYSPAYFSMKYLWNLN